MACAETRAAASSQACCSLPPIIPMSFTAAPVTLRAACEADAPALVHLMNLAGEGIPAYLWEQMKSPLDDTLAFGARRVARTEGGFSHVHATVAEQAGPRGIDVIGMVLGYPQPEPYEVGDLDALLPVIRPLVQLEALAPGSWYVNGIAVLPAWQRQGVARLLMRHALERAWEAGCRSVSLIVAAHNAPARRLYEALGFRERARRPLVPIPGLPATANAAPDEWLLMVAGPAPREATTAGRSPKVVQ